MLNDKHGFLTMDEVVARECVRSRHEEALRYAAFRQARPHRRPVGASVAAMLRGLADRIEPAPERAGLAHQ